jgi:hypothetical protein
MEKASVGDNNIEYETRRAGNEGIALLPRSLSSRGYMGDHALAASCPSLTRRAIAGVDAQARNPSRHTWLVILTAGSLPWWPRSRSRLQSIHSRFSSVDLFQRMLFDIAPPLRAQCLSLVLPRAYAMRVLRERMLAATNLRFGDRDNVAQKRAC